MSIQREVSPLQPIVTHGIATERPANKLLASLPAEDFQRIAVHLKRVPMLARQVLYRQGAPIDSIYFPGGGACALIKATEDGHMTEIAVVGTEGAVGTGVFFGLNHAPCDVIVQMPAPFAEVMPAQAFALEMERRGALHNRVIRYNQALMMQLMQSTACNGLHSAEERCARWLLSSHDRAGQDEFHFTHEFVATMLGVRRPTVTLVAGSLQAAGLIEHRRGRVKILDRAGLEAVACECYRVTRTTVSRLLPELSTGDNTLSAAVQ